MVRVVYVDTLLDRRTPVPLLLTIGHFGVHFLVRSIMAEVVECDKFIAISVHLGGSFVSN